MASPGTKDMESVNISKRYPITDRVPHTVRPLLRWLACPVLAETPPDDHQALGRWGEETAVMFLRRQRHRLLYRNFRAPGGGEVDLVCRDCPQGVLVFVEVKTRRSEARGRPADAVNRGKQALISRGALAWLRLLDYPEIPIRFDIVEVLALPDAALCTHIRNAFQLPDHCHP